MDTASHARRNRAEVAARSSSVVSIAIAAIGLLLVASVGAAGAASPASLDDAGTPTQSESPVVVGSDATDEESVDRPSSDRSEGSNRSRPEAARLATDDGQNATVPGPARDHSEHDVLAPSLRAQVESAPQFDPESASQSDSRSKAQSDSESQFDSESTLQSDAERQSTADTAEQRPTPRQAAERVEVVAVSEPDRAEDAAGAVRALGGSVSVVYADHVGAELPVRAVEALAARDVVQRVRRPAGSVQTGVISEGREMLGADRVHDLGTTGENATIAVFDHEFDPNNEKLRDQIVATKDFRTEDGFSEGTSGLHGTAAAEAVADVAPDAELVLVSVNNDTQFLQATDWLVDETDVDAVTMSLSWNPDLGPLDGSDPVSQRIAATEREHGIVWVTSAGNQGEQESDPPDDGYGKHYDRRWTPDDEHTEYMEFGVVDDWDTALPIRTEGNGTVYVSWDADWAVEDWEENGQRYAVYLFGRDVHANGSVADAEYIGYEATSMPVETFSVDDEYDEYYLEIQQVDADGQQHFDVHTTGSAYLDPAYTVSRSLLPPATGEASIAVGAVDQYDDRVGAYSSRGPTVDGRQGIDVVAPTNVSVLDDEWDRFTGTSASAPHVAGVLGLLADANPALGPADLEQATERTAEAVSGDHASVVDDPGPTVVGAGSVDALAGLQSGWLEGSVRNGETGAGVANATVRVLDDGTTKRTIETSPDGTYEAYLPAGTYDVAVSAGDHLVDARSTAQVVGPHRQTHDVPLDPIHARVTVESAVDGTAIDDATVELVDATGETEFRTTAGAGDTDVVVPAASPVRSDTQTSDAVESGTESSDAVESDVETPDAGNSEPGDYSVVVSHPNYEDERLPIDPSPTETERLSVGLDPLDGALEGTVHGANGTPVAGAAVGVPSADVSVPGANASVPGADAEARTGPNGTFALSGVPSQVAQRVVVHTPAYFANATVSETVPANGTAVRNLTVARRERYVDVRSLDVPSSVDADESIDATASLANRGTADWTDDVELRVDGDVVATTTVALNASERTTVAFEASADDAGTHTVSVATGNASRSTALDVEARSSGGIAISASSSEPDVSLEAASVEESSVAPGDSVAVEVSIRNDGDAAGSIDLAVRANGTTVGTDSMSVPAGTTVEETVSATLETSGTYSIAVDADPGGAADGATADGDPTDTGTADGEPAGTVAVQQEGTAPGDGASDAGSSPDDEPAPGTADAADEPATEGSDADRVPGLGVLAGVVGLLAGAGAIARRQRH